MNDENNAYPSGTGGVYEEVEFIQTEEFVPQEEAGKDVPSTGGLLKKVATNILLGMIALLPILVLPISGFTIEFSKGIFMSAVVLVSVLLCILWWLRAGVITIPRHPAYPVLGALALWYLLSSYASGAFVPSFFGNGEITTSLGMIILVLFLLLIGIFFHSRQNILRAIWFTLLSSVLVFLFQIFHMFFPAQSTLGGLLSAKTQSVVGSWSDLGIFAGVILVLSLVAIETFAHDKARLKGFLYTMLAVSFFFCLLGTYSFSWLIIALVSGVIAFYSYLNASRNGKFAEAPGRRILNPSFIVSVFSLILIFAGSWLNVQVFTTLQLPPSTDVRPSWGGTMEIVGSSLTSGAKEALLGAGPNRFFTEWNKYRPVNVNLTPWWNVDFNSGIGMIPTTLVSVGLVGFMLWALFLVLFFWFGYRALRRTIWGMDHASRFIALSSFAVAAFLWIVLCTNVAGTVIVMLAFLFTGVFTSSMSLEGAFPMKTTSYLRDSKMSFVSVTFLLVLLGLSLVLSYGVFERYRSAFSYRNAVLLSLTGNLDQAEIQMNRAINLSKSDAYYRSYSILSSYRAQQVLQRQDLTPDDVRQQWSTHFRSSVDNAKNATAIDPKNYMNWVTLGNAYAALIPLQVKGISEDAMKNAQENYVIAQKLSPKNPGIPLAIATTLIAAGKNADAEPYLKQALLLKGNYSDALTLLSQISADTGDIDAAISYIEQAMQADPTTPALYFQLGFMKFKNADYQGAASALEQALAITPNYANAQYFLGLTYSKLGRVQEAIKQFEAVKASNPDRTDISAILTNLKNGYPPLSSGVPTPTPAPAAPAKK